MRRYIAFLLIILPSVCLAEYPPIDFYIDGTIGNGEAYSIARTFDNAIVNMTGGLINGTLELHNTSIFNANGGSMDIAFGGGSRITLFDESIINLRNLEGGETLGFPNTLIEASGGSNAQINFYGYGFQFEGVILSGYWANGSRFTFDIRSNDETMDALVFHEIPEPTTFFLMVFGLRHFIRKIRK